MTDVIDKPSKVARQLEFAPIPWIEAMLPKLKGEQMDIKHLWGDHYRVNFRKPEDSGLPGLIFAPIVRSAFVTCRKGDDGKGVIQVK